VAGISRNIEVKQPGEPMGRTAPSPRRVLSPRSPPLKSRQYVHFDDPLTAAQLDAFSITPDAVASHSFLPLLGYEKVTRRMDFEDDFPTLNLKKRDIRYASHTDAAIYGYYGRKLSELYELKLTEAGLEESVLAYRSRIGSNITFAKALFDEVKLAGRCSVACLDISKFFDHIDHVSLERELCAILSVSRLPRDWLKIFIRISKYEYVMKARLDLVLGRRRGSRICGVDVFRSRVRPLIEKNPDAFGIPQGTPLSGTFANISMYQFDKATNAYMKAIGGSYRRYSDDIAILIPGDQDPDKHIEFVLSELKRSKLNINSDKTCRTHFHLNDKGQYYTEDMLQYLGFTFDGNAILIRSASIKNFYARMRRGVRSYVKGARLKRVARDQIRKRVPVGRFTHWGDNRNFVQYAYRAARIMESPAIKRQLRRHVAAFNDVWQRSIDRFYDESQFS